MFLLTAFTGAHIAGVYSTVDLAKMAVYKHLETVGCRDNCCNREWNHNGNCYDFDECACGGMEFVHIEEVELDAPLNFA